MSAFDFEGAQAWEATTDLLLPVGDHVATIRDPEMGESSNHNPQIELRVENALGSLRDWVVITPATIGKVVQLFDAAGVARPQEGEFDKETGKLTDKCVARLANQQVGVVIREEPKYNDPTQYRRRVMGYLDKDQITSDIPADTSGLPTNSAPSSSRPAEEDERVPF